MSINIVVATEKGGVGKTTTVTNLAVCMARFYKKRVLVVDADYQANATKALYPWKKEEQKDENTCDKKDISFAATKRKKRASYPWNTGEITTLKDLFEGMNVLKVIHHSIEPNVDIIAACKSLVVVEKNLGATRMSPSIVLNKLLIPIADKYDVIIFDTHPSVDLLVSNSMYAAHVVIVPFHEDLAIDAANQMIKTIKQFRTDLDKNLMVGGFLHTKYDPRTTLTSDVETDMKEEYGEAVFNTAIPIDVKLAKCMRNNKSIFQYSEESNGASAYKSFTEEFMKRLGMIQ